MKCPVPAAVIINFSSGILILREFSLSVKCCKLPSAKANKIEDPPHAKYLAGLGNGNNVGR